jgi:flagellar FliJ protein
MDEAARQLGEAVRLADAARDKLSVLVGYRDDYANQLRACISVGLPTTEYRNFWSFLERLETAVRGQGNLVRAAEEQVEARRIAWQAAARKHESFLILGGRMKAECMKREGKRDQKMMDEYAARSGLVRRQT